MCGRFALSTSRYELVELLDVDEVDDAPEDELAPRWNVAPTRLVYAVRTSSRDYRRHLSSFRWGLIPFWAKDPSVGNRMINARAESAATRPAYREAFERRRCVLPADGFYEWRRLDERSAAGKRTGIPYYVSSSSGALLFFAGLYDRWRGESGTIESCTILTTPSSGALASIHDRMPLLLDRPLVDRWLDRTPFSTAEWQAMWSDNHGEGLSLWRVSDEVNNPRNDGPQLIAESLDEHEDN